MWPWPRGKYHTSPGSKSFVSAFPCGSMTVVRTRPSITNAHSAAVACQWSSRMAPGSSFIETPAIPLEIGNCSTVASLPKLPPITLPSDFSSSNLKVGNSLPASSGSGTLFMKLGSPASARLVPTRVAVVAAANAAAPVRKSRRWKLDMGSPLVQSWWKGPAFGPDGKGQPDRSVCPGELVEFRVRGCQREVVPVLARNRSLQWLLPLDKRFLQERRCQPRGGGTAPRPGRCRAAVDEAINLPRVGSPGPPLLVPPKVPRIMSEGPFIDFSTEG